MEVLWKHCRKGFVSKLFFRTGYEEKGAEIYFVPGLFSEYVLLPAKPFWQYIRNQRNTMKEENIAVLIVEDKPEEAAITVNAIKAHLGIPMEDEGICFGLRGEKVRASLGKSEDTLYKVGERMIVIAVASDLGEVEVAFGRLIGQADKEGVKRGGTFASAFPQAVIITDLMFPGKKGNTSIQANGIEVILKAIEYAVPVVVCSDTDHHEVSFMQPLALALGKLHPAGKISIILDKKDWEKAVAEVMAISEEMEKRKQENLQP